MLTIIEIYKALRSLKYFELWFTTKPLGSIPSVISGILCIIPTATPKINSSMLKTRHK